MSRWKYKTATVTVGENSQEVRQLTHNERLEFAAQSKKIKADQGDANAILTTVLKFGCVGLTDEDVKGMPPDLADACVEKIMALSGLEDDKPGEKKEPSPTS